MDQCIKQKGPGHGRRGRQEHDGDDGELGPGGGPIGAALDPFRVAGQEEAGDESFQTIRYPRADRHRGRASEEPHDDDVGDEEGRDIGGPLAPGHEKENAELQADAEP